MANGEPFNRPASLQLFLCSLVDAHRRKGTLLALVARSREVPSPYQRTQLLMTTTTRIAKLAGVLSIGFAASLNAQALATFGSAELAGFGEGSALLGTSLSTGHLGLGP